MNFPLRAPAWMRPHQTVIIALAIFAVSFVFFLWLQDAPTFADPDSFYHAKMAILIRDQGVVKDFPWLQFTVLKNVYTDQHFLYHVGLIPFVTFFDPIVGTKIATVLLASAVIMMAYIVLRALHMRLALLYALILLVVTPFTFRMSLAKAPSVSLLFLLLGLWLMARGRRRWLFLVSFLYVWAYGGFALMLILAGAWSVAGIVRDWLERYSRVPDLEHRSLWKRVTQHPDVRTFCAVLFGTVAGIIINPYFPTNLQFYWHQLVKIGIINYQNVIGVGNEWYPYTFIDLVSNTIFLSVIIVIALILFFIFLRVQDRRSWTLMLMAIFFFLLTLKSKRYVEYYVPFGMLYGATAIGAALRHIDFQKFLRDIADWYWRHKIFATILLVYFLVTLPTLAIRDVRSIKRDLMGGSSITRFKAASQWLERNSPRGATVFHSSWDEFPILFYHNHHNTYIVGLDPTFMYEYDRELYTKMVDITTGVGTPNLYQTLTEGFSSRYVLIERSHTSMRSLIAALPEAQLAYEDGDAWIYDLGVSL